MLDQRSKFLEDDVLCLSRTSACFMTEGCPTGQSSLAKIEEAGNY